ncbi:hypothetical protein TIFTF001_014547 [Ficus carica]|uniref:Uncharacterized protein n=1 Tax=Ficus carica TaxID=3494 RepID=A0AA88D8A0_FICCA|nr:hypothetical protein TIFTF001_014547 [Ficus carica]
MNNLCKRLRYYTWVTEFEPEEEYTVDEGGSGHESTQHLPPAVPKPGVRCTDPAGAQVPRLESNISPSGRNPRNEIREFGILKSRQLSGDANNQHFGFNLREEMETLLGVISRANNLGILKVLQTAGAQGIEYIRFQYPKNPDLASTEEKDRKHMGKRKDRRMSNREAPDGRGGREMTSGGEQSCEDSLPSTGCTVNQVWFTV